MHEESQRRDPLTKARNHTGALGGLVDGYVSLPSALANELRRSRCSAGKNRPARETGPVHYVSAIERFFLTSSSFLFLTPSLRRGLQTHFFQKLQLFGWFTINIVLYYYFSNATPILLAPFSFIFPFFFVFVFSGGGYEGRGNVEEATLLFLWDSVNFTMRTKDKKKVFKLIVCCRTLCPLPLIIFIC